MSNYASPTYAAAATGLPAQPRDLGQFERLGNRYETIINRLGILVDRTEIVADKFLGKRPPAPPSPEKILAAPNSVVGAFELAAEEIDRCTQALFDQLDRLETLV